MRTIQCEPVPISDWEWFGFSGHFHDGHWCRFHLATVVGPWFVSTIGDYVHPRYDVPEEDDVDPTWIRDDIGHGRKFETMVFALDRASRCTGEHRPERPTFNGTPLLMHGANDCGEARRNHMAACKMYAARIPG